MPRAPPDFPPGPRPARLRAGHMSPKSPADGLLCFLTGITGAKLNDMAGSGRTSPRSRNIRRPRRRRIWWLRLRRMLQPLLSAGRRRVIVGSAIVRRVGEHGQDGRPFRKWGASCVPLQSSRCSRLGLHRRYPHFVLFREPQSDSGSNRFSIPHQARTARVPSFPDSRVIARPNQMGRGSLSGNH